MKFGYSRGGPTSNPSLNRTPNSRLRRLSFHPDRSNAKQSHFSSRAFPSRFETASLRLVSMIWLTQGRARNIVWQHLEWFSVAHRVRHRVDLNQSWEMKPSSEKPIGIVVSDTGKVTDDVRVSQANIQGKARIVSPAYDSAALSTYSSQVEKSQRDTALAKAMRYFNGNKCSTMTARCTAYIRHWKSSHTP